jgi:hypothetical protein
MSKGKLKELLEGLMKKNYPHTATDGYILIPYDVTRLLNEANNDFPKKKKVYKYHVGGEYGTDIYEETYLQKEIDEWKLKWFGD